MKKIVLLLIANCFILFAKAQNEKVIRSTKSMSTVKKIKDSIPNVTQTLIVPTTQIKQSNEMIKKHTTENNKIIFTNANRDSVELSKLFEAFKNADTEATTKLQLLINKIELVKAKNIAKQDDKANADVELHMISLNSAVSQRGEMLRLTTNLMNAMNDATKSILQNIR
jgi:hypothetical protein